MRRLVCLIVLLGTGSLHTAAQQQTAAAKAAPRVATPHNGSFSSIIQGHALTSANAAMPDVTVRLRDARFGRIVDSQVTDKTGAFTFRDVDPGSYVVEMMAADHSTILAASQLFHVNAGDAISAVVKLPFRIPPFAGLLGSNSVPSAAAIVTEAAANGVLAVTAPGFLGGPTCPLQ